MLAWTAIMKRVIKKNNKVVIVALSTLLVVLIFHHYHKETRKKKQEGLADPSSLITDATNQINGISNSLRGLPDQLGTFGQTLSSLPNSLQAPLQDLTGGLQKLKTVSEVLPDTISKQTQGLLDEVRTETTSFATALNNNMMSGLTSLQKQTAGSVADLGGQITRVGGDLSSFQKQATGSISDLGGQITRVGGDLSAFQKQATGSLKDLGGQITDGLTRVQQETTGKITGLAQQVTDKFIGIEKEIEGKVVGIEKEIEDKVIGIEKEIEGKVLAIEKEVEGRVTGVLSSLKTMFPRLGENIKKILIKAIVDPFKTLFMGIGQIFVDVFALIKMIIDKIVGLPSCMIFYMIAGIESATIGFISFICGKILPTFIMNFFTSVYNGIIRFLVKPVLDFVGYTKAYDKCTGFDTNSAVNDMNSQLSNISKAFTNDWGKINAGDLLDGITF